MNGQSVPDRNEYLHAADMLLHGGSFFLHSRSTTLIKTCTKTVPSCEEQDPRSGALLLQTVPSCEEQGSSLRSSPSRRRCRHVRNRLFAQKLSLSTTPSTMRYSSSLARRSSAFPSVAWTVAFFILSASPAGIRTLMTTSCPYSISGVGRFSFA